jgi:hypothetical protein
MRQVYLKTLPLLAFLEGRVVALVPSELTGIPDKTCTAASLIVCER